MRKKLLNQAMKKGLLLALAIFSIVGSSSLFAQTVEGGAGIIHVNGDPNGIVALQDVSVHEGHIAYDTSAQVVYFFDHDGTAGVDQWIGVDVNAANPTVSGAGDITVTQTGTNYEVSFSETHTTLTWDAADNELTYNSEDGPATVLDLSGAVDFDDSENIEVATGDGTAASPYTFLIVGSDDAGSAGKVPVTDGVDGTLTWTSVIEGATITGDGQLQLTFTDGTTANVNIDSAPKVGNISELDGEIATLTTAAGVSGNVETGIAIAKDNNTFGLPANSNYGVIFFIKSN